MGMRFLPCGEHGMLIELPDLISTLRLFDAVKEADIAGVRELIPAARTLFASFDPLTITRAELTDAIASMDVGAARRHSSKTVSIDVVYDGEDLADVASLMHITPQSVVQRHCGHDWKVAFVGFAPGFAYLTDGDPSFDVPRRRTPRVTVPSGAVGLAGTFSGVYPRQSSGGWQLIGHTDMPMWRDDATPPALLQPGDTVHFTPVRESITAADHASDQDQAQALSQRIGGESAASGNSRRRASQSDASPISDAPQPQCSAACTTRRTGLRVVRPGLLATFQDDGRLAANMGVTGSGAADMPAAHLANALVGNPAHAVTIELTNGSAAFQAVGDQVAAVTGAPVAVTIRPAPNATATGDAQHAERSNVRQSARSFAITRQEAFLLRDGETLEIGAPRAGLRDYVAIAGGFKAPGILGSSATDTMSGIGPAPLHAGQLLPSQAAAKAPIRPTPTVGLPEPWPANLPQVGRATTLEVMLGPRDDWFTEAALAAFVEQEWTVTIQSNRVGLRLAGATPLERRNDVELASEATVPGAIEVPASGQPVIFLRDQPVTGGYPVIAVLTATSLATAGQLPPEAKVRFRISRRYQA